MKVKVGRLQFETLTPDEARAIVGGELDKRFGGDGITTEVVRAEESGVTSAAGALVLPVYVVPAGMEFRTHVLVVECDGQDPSNPFNGAGGFWRLTVAERSVDFDTLVAGSSSPTARLPFTKNYGFMQGAVALNQEPIEFRLNAGPANRLVRVFLQGTLLTSPGRPKEQ